jgi:hypothetical protein
MSQARVAIEGDSRELPSHSAADNGNPASFKPKYLVLDDINVDLISVVVSALTLVSVLFFHAPLVKAIPLMAAVVVPLRTFFPRATKPEGLVLITGASSGIGAELS